MTSVQWLQHCSNKPVLLKDEFVPTNNPHKGCMFTTIIFDEVAYDYMDSDSFEKNFGTSKFIALYVNKVCSHCGEVKSAPDGEEMRFLKIVPNTLANRVRYEYDYIESEDTSE